MHGDPSCTRDVAWQRPVGRQFVVRRNTSNPLGARRRRLMRALHCLRAGSVDRFGSVPGVRVRERQQETCVVSHPFSSDLPCCHPVLTLLCFVRRPQAGDDTPVQLRGASKFFIYAKIALSPKPISVPVPPTASGKKSSSQNRHRKVILLVVSRLSEADFVDFRRFSPIFPRFSPF